MAKEDNPKVEGGTKTKWSCFKKSTSTRKVSFKAPTTGLEDKVFGFWKNKHAEDSVENCEAISKYIAVNYKNGGTKMATEINKVDKPTINLPEVP